MNLEQNDEFSIPSEMVEKIYELSGGVDKYKGVVMAVSSENGKPLIYCKFDCGMTELALIKALENHFTGPVERREEEE